MGSDDDQSYVPSAQEEDSDGDSIMTDPKTKKPDAVNLLNETGCLPSGPREPPLQGREEDPRGESQLSQHQQVGIGAPDLPV